MKRVVLIAALASYGCSDTKKDFGTMQEVAELKLQVTELERQVRELKENDTKQDAFTTETWNQLSSLRKTFNENVDLDNKKTLAAATARGVCGTETVQFADGSWTTRNRECTWKLLGK